MVKGKALWSASAMLQPPREPFQRTPRRTGAIAWDQEAAALRVPSTWSSAHSQEGGCQWAPQWPDPGWLSHFLLASRTVSSIQTEHPAFSLVHIGPSPITASSGRSQHEPVIWVGNQSPTSVPELVTSVHYVSSGWSRMHLNTLHMNWYIQLRDVSWAEPLRGESSIKL